MRRNSWGKLERTRRFLGLSCAAHRIRPFGLMCNSGTGCREPHLTTASGTRFGPTAAPLDCRPIYSCEPDMLGGRVTHDELRWHRAPTRFSGVASASNGFQIGTSYTGAMPISSNVTVSPSRWRNSANRAGRQRPARAQSNWLMSFPFGPGATDGQQFWRILNALIGGWEIDVSSRHPDV